MITRLDNTGGISNQIQSSNQTQSSNETTSKKTIADNIAETLRKIPESTNFWGDFGAVTAGIGGDGLVFTSFNNLK
ncbi:hypothetical protein SAMN02745164_01698 [Marinitoga hydrogenitolerans DSM 16785]|uniref:Uncharacterized protein n=1 Tax=Marinitoga hydrogenitolerans (strain DSM 16785 / JCM 12826 / AT1271) TaxID=1122195 RepID=A0A1M4YK67_MARH1|nr:hypothetical protein [Marinitoga hydrogenitolerans]SHF05892.1 hypothetical protein SAMN02745164_01698 [Marinitoga hydrogenitolerans DSM 16785]